MTVDRSRRPALGPDVSVRFPRVERSTLDNGLQVWSVERRDVPVLTLVLLIRAGSSADPTDQPGLAALTADLLDEGSGELDAVAIHEALARIGGQLETDTGYDSTLVTLVGLARFRMQAVQLLADMAFRPRMDEGDFTRVRELRCNRLAQMRDLPAALAEEAFVEHLYGPHPYGHLPIGRDASLRALRVDDVRAFHRARYGLQGACLIGVGDASHEDIVAASVTATTGLEGNAAAPSPQAVGAMPRVAGRRLVLLDRPGAPQSELRVGHVAAARSTPDYHPLVVLNAVLGGQFVSRINLNLREEKGLTYGARSAFDWRLAPGPFVVQTSVQTDATATAVAEVLRELEDIGGRRPPTPNEVTLAQASLTRGFARNFETGDQVARALAQLAVHGLPDSWYDEFVGRVLAVGGDALVAAARQYLHPEDALVTVVGDRRRVEQELGGLGLIPSAPA